MSVTVELAKDRHTDFFLQTYLQKLVFQFLKFAQILTSWLALSFPIRSEMTCKDPRNIPHYESNFGAYLEELQQGNICLEALEKTAVATGYQLEDLFPLLYD